MADLYIFTIKTDGKCKVFFAGLIEDYDSFRKVGLVACQTTSYRDPVVQPVVDPFGEFTPVDVLTFRKHQNMHKFIFI